MTLTRSHDESTSLQRTYRYLRIGIAATVVVIAVSVVVASIAMGELWPSISAYYYSPARPLFVGALIAAALGIIAISGRGAERLLLDLAGLFAPLIALIPTTIDPARLPGYDGEGCPTTTDCVPEGLQRTVGVGIVTYVAIGLAVWIVALVLTRREPRPRSVVASLILTPVVILGLLATWIFRSDLVLAHGHLVAASAFFILIAFVALFSAAPVDGEQRPTRRVALGYRAIGIVMLVDVAALVAVVIAKADGPAFAPFVLSGEFIALALFVAFWVLQSRRVWDETDPAFAP